MILVPITARLPPGRVFIISRDERACRQRGAAIGDHLARRQWLAGTANAEEDRSVYPAGHSRVERRHNGRRVTVKVLEVATKKIKAIHAKTCILATPQFVNSRLLAADDARKNHSGSFLYQPWMVANITSRKLTERSGAGLSWDNVLYKGRGLGYVEATHQLIGYQGRSRCLPIIFPLPKKAAEERTAAQKRSFEDWVSLIREDLLAGIPILMK